MPIEFRCPVCNKPLQTPDETAGRPTRCPECGEVLRVPGPEVSPDQSPLPAETAGEESVPPDHPAEVLPPSRPPSENETKALASLLLGVSSLLVLWCCCPIGFPVSLMGLVLGIHALRSERHTTAVVGIVLCVVGLILSVVGPMIGLLIYAAISQSNAFQF